MAIQSRVEAVRVRVSIAVHGEGILALSHCHCRPFYFTTLSPTTAPGTLQVPFGQLVGEESLATLDAWYDTRLHLPMH